MHEYVSEGWSKWTELQRATILTCKYWSRINFNSSPSGTTTFSTFLSWTYCLISMESSERISMCATLILCKTCWTAWKQKHEQQTVGIHHINKNISRFCFKSAIHTSNYANIEGDKVYTKTIPDFSEMYNSRSFMHLVYFTDLFTPNQYRCQSSLYQGTQIQCCLNRKKKRSTDFEIIYM